jgi:hypothetical protein
LSTTGTFDSPQEFLSALLERIDTGKIQLPDFQRGWIWDDEHVRSLLASVSLAYPIGAAMAMVTGNEDVRFKPRMFEGVPQSTQSPPDWLILDGQQRLTALYQALFSQRPVATIDPRKKPIKRWYYLDMEKALDPMVDREDAIVALPEDRIIKNFRNEPVDDFSDREREYLECMFPFSKVFNSSDWRMGFEEYWDYDREKIKLFSKFESQVITAFTKYQVPLIVLGPATPKEAVCQVFEKVNTGGVPLNVFELLTATFAADDFNLRDDWDHRLRRLKREKVTSTVGNTDFLQSITLLATWDRRRKVIASGTGIERAPAISCKRKDVLKLTLDEYRRWAEPITVAYEMIPRFLHSQKIFSDRDIPYRTQLTPLAAILALLGDRAETTAFVPISCDGIGAGCLASSTAAQLRLGLQRTFLKSSHGLMVVKSRIPFVTRTSLPRGC